MANECAWAAPKTQLRSYWHGASGIHARTAILVVENTILGLRDGSGPLLDLQRASEKTEDLSNRHGLALDPAAMVESLPIGVQQRVEILKLLYRDARLLILDEPTAVLTPEGENQHLRSCAGSGKWPLGRDRYAQAQRNHGMC